MITSSFRSGSPMLCAHHPAWLNASRVGRPTFVQPCYVCGMLNGSYNCIPRNDPARRPLMSTPWCCPFVSDVTVTATTTQQNTTVTRMFVACAHTNSGRISDGLKVLWRTSFTANETQRRNDTPLRTAVVGCAPTHSYSTFPLWV